MQVSDFKAQLAAARIAVLEESSGNLNNSSTSLAWNHGALGMELDAARSSIGQRRDLFDTIPIPFVRRKYC